MARRCPWAHSSPRKLHRECRYGTYDIGDDVENAGTAKLLKNGTVDSSLKGYIALSGKANV